VKPLETKQKNKEIIERAEEMFEFVDSLRCKGIKVTEIDSWGQYLRCVWEEQFCSNLNKTDKENIFLNYFLWHLFSYHRVICSENEQARTCFNNEIKNSCYVFYQHTDSALIIENAKLMYAKDFDNEDDVYIVDREFRWTYVKTHEPECGPYFYYNNMK
jgi:hypothetical protein